MFSCHQKKIKNYLRFHFTIFSAGIYLACGSPLLCIVHRKSFGFFLSFIFIHRFHWQCAVCNVQSSVHFPPSPPPESALNDLNNNNEMHLVEMHLIEMHCPQNGSQKYVQIVCTEKSGNGKKNPDQIIVISVPACIEHWTKECVTVYRVVKWHKRC